MSFTIVNITKEESKYAKSNGEVYGERRIAGGNKLYVYVELGTERPYRANNKDDINTEYKFFSGCNIFYFRTKNDLDNWSRGEEEIEIIQELQNEQVKICF